MGGGVANNKTLVFGSKTHVNKSQDTTENKDLDQALRSEKIGKNESRTDKRDQGVGLRYADAQGEA